MSERIHVTSRVDAGAAPAPLAEYVRYPAQDRVPLSALLWWPPTGTRAAALFVPGFYGSFANDRQDYAPLARGLTAHGIALMAINLRTASDFTDPRLADCVEDIGAAVAELQRRGFTDIALLGTSLGAVRAVRYLAATDEPMIRGLGLIAPICSPYEEAQWRMDEAERGRLDGFLADCRARVAGPGTAGGRPTDMVVFERWFPGLTVRMTARGFLDVFGTLADNGHSLPSHGASVRVPAAVFHGTKDRISLAPNAQAVHDSLVNAPSRALAWIDGAGHTMDPAPVAQAFADAVVPWVARVLGLETLTNQEPR